MIARRTAAPPALPRQAKPSTLAAQLPPPPPPRSKAPSPPPLPRRPVVTLPDTELIADEDVETSLTATIPDAELPAHEQGCLGPSTRTTPPPLPTPPRGRLVPRLLFAAATFAAVGAAAFSPRVSGSTHPHASALQEASVLAAIGEPKVTDAQQMPSSDLTLDHAGSLAASAHKSKTSAGEAKKRASKPKTAATRKAPVRKTGKSAHKAASH